MEPTVAFGGFRAVAVVRRQWPCQLRCNKMTGRDLEIAQLQHGCRMKSHHTVGAKRENRCGVGIGVGGKRGAVNRSRLGGSLVSKVKINIDVGVDEKENRG